MRDNTQQWIVGEKLSYDAGDGVFLRCTYRGDDEGWASVTCDADEPNAVPVTVRPSRLVARRESDPLALAKLGLIGLE